MVFVIIIIMITVIVIDVLSFLTSLHGFLVGLQLIAWIMYRQEQLSASSQRPATQIACREVLQGCQCSGETRLALHVPSASRAGKCFIVVIIIVVLIVFTITATIVIMTTTVSYCCCYYYDHYYNYCYSAGKAITHDLKATDMNMHTYKHQVYATDMTAQNAYTFEAADSLQSCDITQVLLSSEIAPT